jgi:signal transduction histidine kinase
MLARLEGAVVRLNQFTADASHELRTPTAVIRTTAELALRRERSPEEYRDSLQKIHSESGRMTQLVEDLLTLARADTSLGGMSLTSVSLDLMARDVCYDYQVLAEAKRVNLSWQAPDTTPAVAGNEAALRRLLVVLLDNAIKYTHAGGSITVRVKSERGQPVLEVTDTGVGIPSADIPKIFDRFYRADPSRSRATGSFGLGLSVAKWIANRHDATISVDSVEGAGSTFRVRFPGPEQSDQPSREATRENPTHIS